MKVYLSMKGQGFVATASYDPPLLPRSPERWRLKREIDDRFRADKDRILMVYDTETKELKVVPLSEQTPQRL